LPISNWKVQQTVSVQSSTIGDGISEQLIWSMNRSGCLENQLHQSKVFIPKEESQEIIVLFRNLEKKTSWIIGSLETNCIIARPRLNNTVLLLFDRDSETPTLSFQPEDRKVVDNIPTIAVGANSIRRNRNGSIADNSYPTELWVALGCALFLVLFALLCILVSRISSKKSKNNKSIRQKV